MKNNLSRFLAVAALSISSSALNHALADPARLPDTEVTRAKDYSAWLIDPTGRYAHGVLGDAIEAGGLAIKTPPGRMVYFRLGKDAVFEDRRVRLRDLDNDGIPEAIVIKSYLRRGASVAAYKIGKQHVTPLAEGPAIGRANRWLNIIGIADFNGDGAQDIAYVQTPHLAGIVRVFTLRGRKLIEIGRLSGYTNHVIGSRDLDMARIKISGRQADIVIPVIGQRFLATLGFRNGKLQELSRAPR